MITIFTGGTTYQRQMAMHSAIARKLPNAEVQSDDWIVPALGTLQTWVQRFGYCAIHNYRPLAIAPYVPDMLRAFTKHGYNVWLTIERPEDAPEGLDDIIQYVSITPNTL